MNSYEAALLFIAAVMLAFHLRRQFGAWKPALFLTVLALPPLYLSVERLSQFLTIDEIYATNETLFISWGNLPMWFRVRQRTSDVLFSPPFALLSGMVPSLSAVRLKMLLKCAHWLAAFVVLLAIHHVLSAHFLRKGERRLFFVLFIYTALLLPTNNLALKIYTLDALSLTLGVLALLCVVVALREDDVRYALGGLIVAYLAAQEKAIGTPILIVALATYAAVRTHAQHPRRPLWRVVWNTAQGLSIALLVGIIGALLIVGVRRGGLLIWLLAGAPDPFLSWVWPFIYLLGGGTDGSVLLPREWVLILLGVTFMGACALAALILWAKRTVAEVPPLARTAVLVNSVLIALLALTGVVGVYGVHAYLAPAVPIQPGHYAPTTMFNATILHYGATSRWEHILRHVAFTCAYFVVSLPTAYWLMGIGVGLAVWRHPRAEAGVQALLALVWLLPLGFGVLSLPILPRYLNVALFLFALILALHFNAVLANWPAWRRVILSALLGLLLIAEVLPFAPLYGSFYPLWVRYDETRRSHVTPGHLDPLWTGWGEEVMLAAQQLERWCSAEDNPLGQPCAAIQLYGVFPGQWLNPAPSIDVRMVEFTTPQERTYTASDYYVIPRVATTFQPFPEGVEPVMVIAPRGYAYAWVFRGDDLRRAGVTYDPVDAY